MQQRVSTRTCKAILVQESESEVECLCINVFRVATKTRNFAFYSTAIIILISDRRSTLQISRAYAVRSMVATVEILFDMVYFDSNDLISGLP